MHFDLTYYFLYINELKRKCIHLTSHNVEYNYYYYYTIRKEDQCKHQPNEKHWRIENYKLFRFCNDYVYNIADCSYWIQILISGIVKLITVWYNFHFISILFDVAYFEFVINYTFYPKHYNIIAQVFFGRIFQPFNTIFVEIIKTHYKQTVIVSQSTPLFRKIIV